MYQKRNECESCGERGDFNLFPRKHPIDGRIMQVCFDCLEKFEPIEKDEFPTTPNSNNKKCRIDRS